MDLSKLDTVAGSTRGFFLHLKFGRDLLYVTDAKGERVLDANGEPQKIGLHLRGVDDPHFVRLNDRHLEEAARLRAENGGSISAEQARQRNRWIIAHAVMAPVHILVDGKPVGATHAEIVALFERFPWIYEQAQVAVNDRTRVVGN